MHKNVDIDICSARAAEVRENDRKLESNRYGCSKRFCHAIFWGGKWHKQYKKAHPSTSRGVKAPCGLSQSMKGSMFSRSSDLRHAQRNKRARMRVSHPGRVASHRRRRGALLLLLLLRGAFPVEFDRRWKLRFLSRVLARTLCCLDMSQTDRQKFCSLCKVENLVRSVRFSMLLSCA